MSTNWMFNRDPFTVWRSDRSRHTDSLVSSPIKSSTVNFSSTSTSPVSSSSSRQNSLKTLLGLGNSTEASSISPPFISKGRNPKPSPEGGLASWFAKEGNMNMLGAGAVGVNMLAGLASTLSNLETAREQRKLLKQQLAHNRSVMDNRKQLINQLKGSY